MSLILSLSLCLIALLCFCLAYRAQEGRTLRARWLSSVGGQEDLSALDGYLERIQEATRQGSDESVPVARRLAEATETLGAFADAVRELVSVNAAPLAIDAAQDGGPLAAAAGYRSPEDEPSATWCAMRPAIPLWHRPQARRPRAPWALTLLLLVGLLCWCVGDRVARGSGPNTGAGSASLSTQGGARTKDPPPPPPPPPPQSEGIDEPRVHRVLQPPADREPPLGQDPARTLPGSLRALATRMGAVSLLALFMAGCAAAAGALGLLLWQRRRRNEITLGGGE